jgi:hypothetical protein
MPLPRDESFAAGSLGADAWGRLAWRPPRARRWSSGRKPLVPHSDADTSRLASSGIFHPSSLVPRPSSVLSFAPSASALGLLELGRARFVAPNHNPLLHTPLAAPTSTSTPTPSPSPTASPTHPQPHLPHPQWLVPSRPPASRPEERPPASSLPPRPPASRPPRPVVSRSPTATVPERSLSVRSGGTRR